MSFKIAASDFDGTLFRNRQISEEDLTAIKNWRSAGNKFGIVSGRAYTMLPSHFQKFNLKLDFAICDNGAIIYDGDEKIVYETELPKEILFEIIKEPFAEESLHVAFETSETVYCTSIKPASWLLREKEGWQSPLIMIEVAQIASLSKINQMALAFQSPEEAFAAAEKLNQKFGEYIFAQKNTHSVDIVVAGVNKGSGVENLLRVNNWSGKAYVIGDESNDLPMIRKFGGFTVSTAKDFVKHEATKVFDSVGAMLNNYCF
ncbi:MAG: HAD-IIB family hydrolase [Selenomonadaceae bacterium]|nr:HAD-IIB family hydrolase [Selenomonadaceae bacterium]